MLPNGTVDPESVNKFNVLAWVSSEERAGDEQGMGWLVFGVDGNEYEHEMST